MGRVARLRKLQIRKERQESLAFASGSLEAREAEIRKANREEKARKMAKEYGISEKEAMKLLLQKYRERKEGVTETKNPLPSKRKNNLQSAGTDN